MKITHNGADCVKSSKCIEKKLNLGLCDYKMHASITIRLNKKI